jgi:FKBP-type peptidyl-prolyl cis-trans isomerase FklB
MWVVNQPRFAGLQYEILKSGSGAGAETTSDICRVHYTGKLISGKVFDSSVARGAPAEFAPNGRLANFRQRIRFPSLCVVAVP